MHQEAGRSLGAAAAAVSEMLEAGLFLLKVAEARNAARFFALPSVRRQFPSAGLESTFRRNAEGGDDAGPDDFLEFVLAASEATDEQFGIATTADHSAAGYLGEINNFQEAVGVV